MDYHRITRTVAPTSKIITLADAKAHLSVSHDGDDTLINNLIDAATAAIDGPSGVGIAMIDQTYRLSLDTLPACVELPVFPARTVVSIIVDGEPIDPADYRLDSDCSPAKIHTTARTARPGTVKITYTAGFGTTAADVPADLRAAALLIIGHLYAHREAVMEGTHKELPLGVATILRRYS